MSVDVSIGTVPQELGIQVAEGKLAEWAEAPLGSEGGKRGGWDYAKSPITLGLPGFLGRIGQLTITVTSQDIRYDVPAPKMAALAASVRDRIPDRPFRDPAGNQAVAGPSGPDPCRLLSRSEAEEVLGPLTVGPYRTQKGSPYPEARGRSCAYRTAGHRVLALTPEWADGRSLLKATQLGGGIASPALGSAPEAADTLEGPWDEAASDLAAASLVFLTGDRALEVVYGTSSTDAGGAVRLARIAVGRLTQGPPR